MLANLGLHTARYGVTKYLLIEQNSIAGITPFLLSRWHIEEMTVHKQRTGKKDNKTITPM